VSKYRDRLQIIADILSIAGRRARKTQIMYQANLSYKLLCGYLDEVVNAGLICYEDEDHYVLTPKGKMFLERYREYSRRLKYLNEKLSHVTSMKAGLERMCDNSHYT